MKAIKHTSVDSYINAFPPPAQKTLLTLRKIILGTGRDITESISYSMPAYAIRGKYLAYFALWKNHLSIYPATDSVHPSMKRLAPYRTGKGTFSFSLDDTIPFDLIADYIDTRAKEIRASISEAS